MELPLAPLATRLPYTTLFRSRQRRRYAGIFCPNFILKTLSSGLSLPGNRTEGSLVQREALERSPCSPEVGVTAEPLAGLFATACRPSAAAQRARKSTRLNSRHVAIS